MDKAMDNPCPREIVDTETRRAHERITGLEDMFFKHLEGHNRFEQAIVENTRITKEIAKNTSDIVAFFAGAKGLRTFILWASPVIIIIMAVWTWLKMQAAG